MIPTLTFVSITLACFAKGSQGVDRQAIAAELPFVDPDPTSVPDDESLQRLKGLSDKQCEHNTDVEQVECQVAAYGYQLEFHWQKGFCKGKKCVKRDIPYGCKDPQKAINKEPEGRSQLGCGYLCFKEGSQTELEYGMYPAGTLCMHAIGLRELKDLKCIQWQNYTVCRETMPRPLGC
ncbi:uncharacterized protein LOC144137646 isoform X1 [Haemaphysalis longicornis]